MLVKKLAVALAVWDLASAAVCILFAKELFLNRIPADRESRVISFVVFAGLALQALWRTRRRFRQTFGLRD